MSIFLKSLLGLLLIPFFLNAELDIKTHKTLFLSSLSKDPLKRNNPSYPLSRVLRTISADDTDDIPKVARAGEVFRENATTYQLMHNGVKIVKDCYYAPWISDIIYGLRGHHEPQEERVFYEVLKYIPGNATMIELGAYWGYYSLWFSQAIPGARNYLIEPDKELLAIGKENFLLNNKTGFFYNGYAGARVNDDANYQGTELILIDPFLAKENIDHVHILHSDIQGAELEMLKTCEQSIQSKKIDYFFVSTHSDEIHENCLKFLKRHKYMIIAEHTMSQSVSYDGLIVAKRKGVKGPDHVFIKK